MRSLDPSLYEGTQISFTAGLLCLKKDCFILSYTVTTYSFSRSSYSGFAASIFSLQVQLSQLDCMVAKSFPGGGGESPIEK